MASASSRIQGLRRRGTPRHRRGDGFPRASVPRLQHLLLLGCSTLALLGTVGCKNKVFDASAPGQKGHNNPTHDMAQDGFEQRQRDCWDMPNAAACYEVGLNYELGISVNQDRKEALSYYDKACSISDDPEHCDAADKMRAKLAP